MEIKLITGETAFQAAINTIKQIDTKDHEMENIVVVPDSFSMQAESLIFDVLKIKSTFNIEVVGISRLARKILQNNNIDFKRISGLEEVFCLYQAVEECKPQFRYFNKCGVDFCVKLLQIIKQFKGCRIKPSQIKDVGDALLDRKMSDLKMIYSRYEELLEDKLDLSKMLDYFLEKTENEINLKNINLFFINFDSFTAEINNFICRLANNVNKMFIGYARPLSVGNAFIFEDDIFRKTTSLAKENKVLVGVENFSANLADERLDIVKNLFSFDIEKKPSDYFVNFVAKNKMDEVEFVAKYIKHKIFEGAKFKDFQIAVADKSYFETLKNIFQQYEIAYYCDDAVDLSQTILGRFLFKILQISKEGFDKENLKYIVASPLFRQDGFETVLKEMFYFNVEQESEFLSRWPNYTNVIGKINALKNCHTVFEIVQKLKDFLDITNEKHEILLSQMQNDFYYKKESENSQARVLIESVLDKLAELAKNQQVLIEDFESLLDLALRSIKVETIPSYVDAVYVGDVTDSYFQDVDYLIVLGATSTNLPKTKNDTGIIDDDDIKKLKIEFALEPEIKVLNRRNRLKLFELLQHGLKKLIVCFPMFEGKNQMQKAGFVNDLISLFGENIIHTASAEDINLVILSPQESLEKLMFFVGAKSNLVNAYSFLSSKGKLTLSQERNLKNLLKSTFIGESKKNRLKINTKVHREYLSVSALESFFACPFKYFLNYVLKVKPNENIEPTKRLFGTFQHALLKKFVEQNKNNLAFVNKNQIETFLDENVIKIAKDVYDKKILERKHFTSFLRNESRVVLNNVVKEQKHGDFRPIWLEKKISDDLEGLKIVGYVDRVDICGNYFRIVDYKTGKTDGLKKDLFYGKKLQLFLYAEVVKKHLGLDCAGVYYFDCQTKYTKLNKSSNLLKGVTIRQDEVVLMSDRELEDEEKKSEILGMSRKKNVKNGEFSFKNGCSVENLDRLIDYSVKISTNAQKEIEEGTFEYKPLKGECDICPFISICKHRDIDGFRQQQSVDDENF